MPWKSDLLHFRLYRHLKLDYNILSRLRSPCGKGCLDPPRPSCRPVGARRSEHGYVHINLRLERLLFEGGQRQDRHVQAGGLPQTQLNAHDANYAQWLLLSVTIAGGRHRQRWTAKVQASLIHKLTATSSSRPGVTSLKPAAKQAPLRPSAARTTCTD